MRTTDQHEITAAEVLARRGYYTRAASMVHAPHHQHVMAENGHPALATVHNGTLCIYILAEHYDLTRPDDALNEATHPHPRTLRLAREADTPARSTLTHKEIDALENPQAAEPSDFLFTPPDDIRHTRH